MKESSANYDISPSNFFRDMKRQKHRRMAKSLLYETWKNMTHQPFLYFDPQGRPQSRSVVITGCPSVRHKTSKQSENHCRQGLWAGRVDH